MTFGDIHSHMKEKLQAKKAEAEARGCPRSRKANCSSSNSPATNKAILYKALREPPVLEERPIPTAQGSQVRITVTSAALNLVDWKIYKYGIILENFPFTGGIDVVGVVDQIGPDVKKFKLGDTVMWQGSWFPNTADVNGYQQYAAHDEAFASLIPSNLSEDQAASIPCTAFTAFVGLFDVTGLNIPFSPDKPLASGASVPGGILITGGNSTVGKFAIQFARMAGISPIITAASMKHAETLKALGCTYVIDRTLTQEEQAKQIRDVVGDELVYCFDAISEEGTQRLARSVLSDTEKSTMLFQDWRNWRWRGPRPNGLFIPKNNNSI